MALLLGRRRSLSHRDRGSPASGVEASAYRRRGIRPASRAARPASTAPADRPRHRRRVLGARDRARAQHGVAAELHRQRGVGGRADAGVEDHRDADALADEREVVGVADAHAAADRRAERHHRRAADVLQAPGEHGSSFVYGQHDEAVVDELLGRLQQLGRVGQQRAVVADHLELDPVGLERLARQPGGHDGVARRVAAGGVGQQLARRPRRARRRSSRAPPGRRAAARR